MAAGAPHVRQAGSALSRSLALHGSPEPSEPLCLCPLPSLPGQPLSASTRTLTYTTSVWLPASSTSLYSSLLPPPAHTPAGGQQQEM